MSEGWYSMKEVLKLIPVTRSTIDRWVNDPDYAHIGFPKPHIIGSRLFWWPGELQVFMDRYLKK